LSEGGIKNGTLKKKKEESVQALKKRSRGRPAEQGKRTHYSADVENLLKSEERGKKTGLDWGIREEKTWFMSYEKGQGSDKRQAGKRSTRT